MEEISLHTFHVEINFHVNNDVIVFYSFIQAYNKSEAIIKCFNDETMRLLDLKNVLFCSISANEYKTPCD